MTRIPNSRLIHVPFSLKIIAQNILEQTVLQRAWAREISHPYPTIPCFVLLLIGSHFEKSLYHGMDGLGDASGIKDPDNHHLPKTHAAQAMVQIIKLMIILQK